MAVYAVVLKDISKKDISIDGIKNRFPESQIYNYSENVFFVSIKEFIYINELAKIIGFSPENNVTGFVLKFSTIQGFDNPNLWEWIEKDDV